MKEEDLKLIASIGDWSDVNKIMMQIYYEQFGKLLEQKLDSVQQCKLPIKECIKQAYGSSKVPITPKRLNPTKKLLEQIHQIKTLCFESDDDEEKEKKSVESNGIPQRIVIEQSAEESLVESRISAELKDVSMEMPQVQKKKKSALPVGKNNAIHTKTNPVKKPKAPVEALGYVVKDIRPAPEVLKTPVIRAKSAAKKTIQVPASTPAQVVRKSNRLQKIKEIQEKTEQAHKQREELLKEKAERTKRELEERRQRVEQNNRRLEQEKQERDDAIRAKTNSPFTPTASRSALPKFVPLPFFHSSPSPPPVIKHIRAIIDSSVESSQEVPETPSPALRRVNFSSTKSLNMTEEVINDSQASSKIDQKTVETSGLDESDASNIPRNVVNPSAKNVPNVLTNYDVDDLSSNDETDDDENPRKVIPLWARPETLKKHVLSVNQLVGHSRSEYHFGQIKKPELHVLFPDYVPRKQPVRKSKVSAMWESPLTDPRVGQSRFQKFSQRDHRARNF